MVRRGLALLIAAMLPCLPAFAARPSHAQVEALLRGHGLHDVRAWYFADSSRDSWQVSVDYAPRQIEPQFCVFSGTTMFVRRDAHGLTAHVDPPDTFGAFASCDRVWRKKLRTVIFGSGPSDIAGLTALKHFLQGIVGVRRPIGALLRYDTPKLRSVLARAHMSEVFIMYLDADGSAFVYLDTPGLKKYPLGLQIGPRGKGPVKVYVFPQTMPLAD